MSHPKDTCPQCSGTKQASSRLCQSCGNRAKGGGPEARFWSYVDQSGGPNACWPWMGGRSEKGYGKFTAGSRTQGAHRVAWELTSGPIPNGILIRHLVCDNPPCCNPAHLALGTDANNAADRDGKGRHVSGMRTRPDRAARGEKVAGAKLTENDVRDIRQRFARGGVSQGALAREYGISRPSIAAVISGDSWKHID